MRSIKENIKEVIFNDPATIILWKDGTKTVVKCENEPYDPEKGLAMAIVKKALGNKGNYYDIFRKWLPKDELIDIEPDMRVAHLIQLFLLGKEDNE